MTKKELQQKLAEARQKIIELEQQRDTLIKIAGELQNKSINIPWVSTGETDGDPDSTIRNWCGPGEMVFT
jgi:hypothetical protein